MMHVSAFTVAKDLHLREWKSSFSCPFFGLPEKIKTSTVMWWTDEHHLTSKKQSARIMLFRYIKEGT